MVIVASVHGWGTKKTKKPKEKAQLSMLGYIKYLKTARPDGSKRQSRFERARTNVWTVTQGRTFCRPVTTSFFSANQLISTEMTLRGEESTHFQFWRRRQMTLKRQLLTT